MTPADGPRQAYGAVLPRRSAVIVAIDAAGYSRQSEVDEATAVREVTALGERIRAGAAARGGRVFNTAGDGFMLEFPSAAAAVAGAEEVQAVDRVPLRIGVHMGEVHETPSGDLLGKGVNIAARLMQAAAPGSILVSVDAKEALPDETVARLTRRGVVRLDKMNERIEAFELASPWAKPRAFPVRPLVVGACILLALAIAWLAAQALIRPAPQRVAVLEFRALDPALQSFVVGLADRLIGAMSASDLQAAHTTASTDNDRVAAAAATGASLVLDGTVRADDDELLVSARLLDTRGNVAVWSNEYRRIAGEQNYMQEQIAADVARVLHCALIGVRPKSGRLDVATLSTFLRACDRLDGFNTDPRETHRILRQVTERAPRF